jgi:hypothetical protein
MKRNNGSMNSTPTCSQSPPRRRGESSIQLTTSGTSKRDDKGIGGAASYDSDMEKKMPAVPRLFTREGNKNDAPTLELDDLVEEQKPPPPKSYQLFSIEDPARYPVERDDKEEWETWIEDDVVPVAPEPVWETWADVEASGKPDDSSSWEAPDDEVLMIQVYPGLSLPLRGSNETQPAISTGFICALLCLECTLQIFCIKDAEYVICPLCHFVTPLEFMGLRLPNSHGVGLGFQSTEE